jgi:nucleoside-diphosphate-sugar epimerase
VSDPRRSALVTGAAGFIGSALCDELLRTGHRVVGVDALTPTYAPALKQRNIAAALAHPDFTLVEAPIATAPLEALLEDVATVYHLAARPGVRQSWHDFPEYLDSNVAATKRLLDACVGRGVRVVYASSSSVYGDAVALPVTEGQDLSPVSPYGATKVATEVIAGAYQRSHGLETVGLRYFTVYGPRQRPDMAISRFVDAADAGQEIGIFGDGRQLRDFTYVGDVVAATLLAAAHGEPGDVYNIASGAPYPLLELLEQLGEVLDRELQLRFDPLQVGDVRDTWASIERARDQLGYEPATTLRAGLEAQAREARARRDAVPG